MAFSERLALGLCAAAPWLLLGMPIVYLDLAIFGDAMAQEFPVRHFHGSMWLRGAFPFWAPQINGGAPFAADIQTALFYPPNWIFALVAATGSVTAWQLDVVLHCSIFLVGLFLFARSTGLRLYGALLFSFGCGLGGGTLAHLGHFAFTHAMAWWPFLLLGIRRFAGEPLWRWAWLSGIALGLVLLSGSPPAAQLVILFTGGYAVSLLCRGAVRISLTGWKWIRLPIAALVCALPALLQISLTYPLYLLSSRHEWPFEMLLGFHAPLRSLWHLVYGQWYGYVPQPGHWEFDVYAGPLVAFVAVPFLLRCLFRRRWPVALDRSTAWFFLLMIPVAIVFAHAHNPIYIAWLKFAPGFQTFRVPGRFYLLLLPCLAWFAGAGLDRMLRLPAPGKKTAIHSARTIGRYAATLIAILFLFILPFYKNDRLILDAEGLLAFAPDFSVVFTSLFLCMLLLLVRPGSRFKRVLSWCALLVTALAPLYFKFPLVAPQARNDARDCASMLRCQDRTHAALFHGNAPLLKPLDHWSAAGYPSIELQRTYEWKERLSQRKSSIAFERASAVPTAMQRGASAGFFTPAHAQSAGDTVWEHLLSNDGRCPMFIEETDLGNHPTGPAPPRTGDVNTRDYDCIDVAWKSSGPNAFVATLPVARSGWLYLAQTYFPGWRAMNSDGEERRVLRANGNFLAIEIHAGDSTITLEQRPFLQLPFLPGIRM